LVNFNRSPQILVEVVSRSENMRIFAVNVPPKTRACYQLKDFVAKMAGFENRIAEYIKAYF
jgi:hypothetical protein